MTHQAWHVVAMLITTPLTAFNARSVFHYLQEAEFKIAATPLSFLYFIAAELGLLHGKAFDRLYQVSIAIYLLALWLGPGGGGKRLRKLANKASSALTSVGEAAFRRDVEATG